MNQDFGLSLTPANARRLLLLQKVSHIVLPEEVEHLAQQDMIGEDAFDDFVCPYNEEKRIITQFLLDCDGRGIVQTMYHRFGIMEVLNTAKLLKPESIVIFTEQKAPWQLAAKAFFLNVIIRSPFDLSNEEIDLYRSGMLIVDVDHGPKCLLKIRNFATEFQKTILFDQSIAHCPWVFLAGVLFPTMPNPLYSKIVVNIPSVWKDKSISMFAPYYNMCLFPEFIKDLNILSDLVLNFRLIQYKNNHY